MKWVIDLIKLLADKRFLKYYFNQPIIGQFDERSNNALIVFDKDTKDNNKKDEYYLIIIDSETTISEEISFDILAISKDDSQYSLPINEYISGSFNLINNEVQSQKYYINDAKKDKDNYFIIEFSSNYENIEIDFINNTDSNKIFLNKTNIGRIYKYKIKIEYNEAIDNYFLVKLKEHQTIKGDNKKYLQNANYILRYFYEDDIEEIYNFFKFNAIKEFTNNSFIIRINKDIDQKIYSGNYSDNYEFTYIFYIYENESILKNELIDTIAPIDSEKTYLDIAYDNETFSQKNITLDNIYDKEYTGSVFLIVQDINDKNKKSYYSYTFNISKNEKKKKKLKLAEILISIIFVIIIIIIIIICIKYRNVIKRNKTLEEKVNSISFSENGEEKSSSLEDVIFV